MGSWWSAHARLRLLLGIVVAAGSACRTAPEPPKVVTIQQLQERLYVMAGGGGNTLALVTSGGVVLVDTKLPGWGPAILERLKEVTDKQVTMIINTHGHGDHFRGNEFFTSAGTIVAHENTRAIMANLPAFEGENAKYLPNTTFTTKRVFTSGDDLIEVRYYGAAHTNGDTVVVIPKLRVAHMGDLFPGKVPPIIVRLQGGSGVAYSDTLARAASDLQGIETIVTGHGAAHATPADLQEYAAAVRHLADWTTTQFQSGRSAEDAGFAFRLPETYRGYTDAWRFTTDVQLIYEELSGVAPHSFRPWWRFW